MLMNFTERHVIPGGSFSTLYNQMAKQTHLLVAGRTGSGKSTVINGIIHSQLVQKSCRQEQFILIDPKRVELSQWRFVPHCISYSADDPSDRIQSLVLAEDIMADRFRIMEANHQRKYEGGTVHVIIDELADLLTTQKDSVLPLLQRIGQIGRAANVLLICCTQCPTAQILSTQLRCNFTSILGLRTRSAQDSRNIIGMKGCEALPEFGKGYYITPRSEGIVSLPMIPESELERVATHWSNRKYYVA